MGQKGPVNTDPAGARPSLLLPAGSQDPWNRRRKRYFSKSLYLNFLGLGLYGRVLLSPLLQGSLLFPLWGQTVMMGEQKKG